MFPLVRLRQRAHDNFTSSIKFDKSKFTKLLKARPEADEWKAMKVFKRMVPNVPDFHQ